ncbi:hypothetical protein MVEN_01656300 [Mycena venus]|uniref:Uncharacterized protein n=1 Tax=Mycena venus TaxID=2733690 RepID=A0A8H7CQW0_9AGAR|nr:hypothetical protein MVEN_01656300 [Mycena venus]
MSSCVIDLHPPPSFPPAVAPNGLLAHPPSAAALLSSSAARRLRSVSAALLRQPPTFDHGPLAGNRPKPPTSLSVYAPLVSRCAASFGRRTSSLAVLPPASSAAPAFTSLASQRHLSLLPIFPSAYPLVPPLPCRRTLAM